MALRPNSSIRSGTRARRRLGVAVLLVLARFGDGDLERRVLDRLHHVLAQRAQDLAGLVREPHLDVGGGAVLLADRAGEPGLERLDQQRASTLFSRVIWLKASRIS